LAAALGAGLLLVSFSLEVTLVVAVLAIIGVATLLEPLAGLVGALFLGLMRAYLQAEVPQIPAQIGHVFVFLSVAVWLARGMARRELRIPRVPLWLPLLGFVGAAWISLWDAVDLAGYGLTEFFKWIEILLVFLLVAERARARHLVWLAAGVLVIGLFQAGVGLYQFGLRGDGPEHFMIPNTDFYRAYGTFEQPNPYAGYLGLTLALAAGLVAGLLRDEVVRDGHLRSLSDAKLVPTLLLLLTTGLLAASLFASWSRGAWIGLAAALVAIAAALPRHARWGFLLVGLLAGLALTAYVAGVVPQSVIVRLTDFAAGLRLEDVRGVGINDANYAVVERLAHWQAALEMWRYDFWTGVGLGCYEAAYADFALINWPFALGHAHNIYLNLLAETGLLGLVTYLALWGAVFWQTWRATRLTAGLQRGLALGLLGVWTHLTVHHLFDNLYVNNVHLLVGLLLGVLAVLRKPDTKAAHSLAIGET
jgi:O-antigen ligase